jgi:hypothetical protein
MFLIRPCRGGVLGGATDHSRSTWLPASHAVRLRIRCGPSYNFVNDARAVFHAGDRKFES